MHDAYTIGIPVLVILIANFINRADIKDLRSEMKDVRSEINARFDKVDRLFDAIDAELRYFHGRDGQA